MLPTQRKPHASYRIRRRLHLIEQVISEPPAGIGVLALVRALSAYPPHINRRTLQLRPKKIRDERRITTEGESTALVYKPLPDLTDIESTLSSLSGNPESSDSNPVSKEGAIIRDLIRQPVPQRKPIGYRRSFLEDYELGVFFYLLASQRKELHGIGGLQTEKRPAGTYAREILHRLLIDLSWFPSCLEGNIYSRLNTERLIAFGQAAEGKDLQETQMILNYKVAIEMLVEESDQVGFNMFTFFNLHAILLDNLLPDDNAPGRLRRRPVDISGSVFHPLVMPQALEECLRLLLRKATTIPDPFERSFFYHGATALSSAL